MTPIYLDNHATTPLDPRVLEAMLPYFKGDFGNPASRQHAFGWKAQAAVDVARGQIARALNASAEEIIFTSGATESNNLAILGLAENLSEKGKHLISAATEHKSVLDPLAYLQEKGWDVTLLPVAADGGIDLKRLEAAIRPDTVLITLMAANNEIGTLHPVAEIGRIARSHGVLFHSDAVQAAGKIPLDAKSDGIDLLSLSAHKFYGPKGIGALYLRKSPPRFRLAPRLYGGGHEGGLRSGTLAVPLIVGMGKALELAVSEMEPDNARIRALRDRLWQTIRSGVSEVRRNSSAPSSLDNNLNLCFPGVPADRLMMELRDIAFSSGSACTTASAHPSHVLKAIGLSPDDAKCSVRLGLGRLTTESEIEQAGEQVVQAVRRIGGESAKKVLI